MIKLKQHFAVKAAIKKFTTAGVEKRAATALVNKLVIASKKYGATRQDFDALVTVLINSFLRGYMDDVELKVVGDRCPPILNAIMRNYGYTHRNLIRHAEKKKITGEKVVASIMKGF